MRPLFDPHGDIVNPCLDVIHEWMKAANDYCMLPYLTPGPYSFAKSDNVYENTESILTPFDTYKAWMLRRRMEWEKVEAAYEKVRACYAENGMLQDGDEIVPE